MKFHKSLVFASKEIRQQVTELVPNGKAYPIDSIFVVLLPLPEECVASLMFADGSFLRKTSFIESNDVDVISS